MLFICKKNIILAFIIEQINVTINNCIVTSLLLLFIHLSSYELLQFVLGLKGVGEIKQKRFHSGIDNNSFLLSYSALPRSQEQFILINHNGQDLFVVSLLLYAKSET